MGYRRHAPFLSRRLTKGFVMNKLKFLGAALGVVLSSQAFAVPSPVADMTTAMDYPTVKTDMVALVQSNIGIAMVIIAALLAVGLFRKFAK